MVAKRRRKSTSKRKIHRRRLKWAKKLFGGDLPNGIGFAQPLDIHLEVEEALRKRKEQKKDDPKWWHFPTRIHNWANKDTLEKEKMEQIVGQYKFGNDEMKKLALNELRTQLIINDINANPKDYIEEYMKGGHRQRKWVKNAARLGIGTATAATAAVLAYAWGLPGMIAGMAHGAAPAIASDVANQGLGGNETKEVLDAAANIASNTTQGSTIGDAVVKGAASSGTGIAVNEGYQKLQGAINSGNSTSAPSVDNGKCLPSEKPTLYDAGNTTVSDNPVNYDDLSDVLAKGPVSKPSSFDEFKTTKSKYILGNKIEKFKGYDSLDHREELNKQYKSLGQDTNIGVEIPNKSTGDPAPLAIYRPDENSLKKRFTDRVLFKKLDTAPFTPDKIDIQVKNIYTDPRAFFNDLSKKPELLTIQPAGNPGYLGKIKSPGGKDLLRVISDDGRPGVIKPDKLTQFARDNPIGFEHFNAKFDKGVDELAALHIRQYGKYTPGAKVKTSKFSLWPFTSSEVEKALKELDYSLPKINGKTTYKYKNFAPKTGKGFKVTRRGRKLLRKYRRHLRRKRH